MGGNASTSHLRGKCYSRFIILCKATLTKNMVNSAGFRIVTKCILFSSMYHFHYPFFLHFVDLSSKMFTFPEKTRTANVRLTTSGQMFSAVTVCLRSMTDLSRSHALFSLSTPSSDNGFRILKGAANDAINVSVLNVGAGFRGQDYKLNTWHPICSTWDSESGLAQLWLDGKPSIRKFTGGSNITDPIVILGQEQDSYGGKFDRRQSFVGMITDVHMWDHTLSSCEIQRYVDDRNFSPGNVLNWRALEFQTTGRVLIENKQSPCY
ncbi:serum amyloid P-component-like isoform X1 [Acanthopagrus latus]|uniref:serum amyloid P-component-like isoform X1 n=1 Tax=Acanthopagrus latus TaxID=8177 RepID=UPI00187C4409|nr:serum amyloid P-component-like isoform X1 [Acanthopagrus latus]